MTPSPTLPRKREREPTEPAPSLSRLRGRVPRSSERGGWGHRIYQIQWRPTATRTTVSQGGPHEHSPEPATDPSRRDHGPVALLAQDLRNARGGERPARALARDHAVAERGRAEFTGL